jgi:hypothetical protein
MAKLTEDQINSINLFQELKVFHPFTCGGDDCRETLVADEDGLCCVRCGYRQTFIHGFMSDWSWVPPDDQTYFWKRLAGYSEGTIQDLRARRDRR